MATIYGTGDCPCAPSRRRYYLSWLIVYTPLFVLSAAIQTAVMRAINVYPNSDYFLVFLSISFAGLTMLTWTFLIVASAKSDANAPEQAKQM